MACEALGQWGSWPNMKNKTDMIPRMKLFWEQHCWINREQAWRQPEQNSAKHTGDSEASCSKHQEQEIMRIEIRLKWSQVNQHERHELTPAPRSGASAVAWARTDWESQVSLHPKLPFNPYKHFCWNKQVKT